jgi:hypothetical protein
MPPKVKNGTTIWSSNLTTVYISKGNGINISKRLLHSYVFAVLFTTAKIRTKIKKMYTMEGGLATEMDEILQFVISCRNLK